MSDNDQTQKVGDGALAIQAAGNITIGVSVSDVRTIALDVFKANFLDLSGQAKDTASSRAVEFTDKCLAKLADSYSEGLNQARSPDFLHSLFSAQRTYARTGDEDLGRILIDLLIDRSKKERRDLEQIVIAEAIETVAKLTKDQINSLALIFITRYAGNNLINSIDSLGQYLDKHFKPLADTPALGEASVQHLQFTGCGMVMALSDISFERIFLREFRALFCNGFDDSDLALNSIDNDFYRQWVMPCLRDASKIQGRILNDANIDLLGKERNFTADQIMRLKFMHGFGVMSEQETRSAIVSLRPYMQQIIEFWDAGTMKHIFLSSVGIAIGHATVKTWAEDFGPLSTWIH